MANAGASIEAVLRLNAQPFESGIQTSINAVNKLVTSLNKLSSTSATNGVQRLNEALIQLESSLQMVGSISKSNLNTFSKLSTAINKMANGLKILQSGTLNVEQAVNTMNSIFKAFQGTLSSVTVNLDKVVVAENKVASATRMSVAEQQKRLATLNANRNSVMNLITGNNQLSASEEKVSASTTKATSSVQRQAVANRTATASTNQLTSATSRLGKAMNSLRMMGSLVGSMLAYNFAHKLLVATGETIHAKSEMEGYFKMLNFGSDEVAKFNNALDETVQRFQRVNKYSLGETISSIGVEFNLTTDEMIKAMDVTSMITSEYLRAGRNANEASLAVKDVLQGQFQRLSRETGVKGEQLKEAGWNGDVTDVESLLDALRKVGEARHWDVFAEKANSMNDILTILQNRFGEWSAEMVNIVQPSIVNTFNAIMSVAGALSGVLGGLWSWLNTDGWGQTAVKIGAVGTALLTVSQMLVMYRTGMGLAQASQLGFSKTLASVVLGLKGQQIAEVGVRNAIMSKIVGVRAGTLAEKGMTMAIRESILQRKLETIEEKINSASKGENTIASKLNAVEKQFEKAQTEGLIVAKSKETIEEDLNTASKELNALASIEQTGANTGLLASLYLLGTGETMATGTTIGLAEAMGILNGVFMLSPIGWITAGILALAGAIYVLTGGLDDLWGSLQNANKAVEDGASAIKPYQNYVNETNQELETAKQKYGENSLIVQQLSDKYDNAKNSLDAYYKKLQSTTLMHNELNKELETTGARMDTIMRTKFGDMGYDSSQIEEMTTGISDLDRLLDHDYVAMQKHEKMLQNFGYSIGDFAKHTDDVDKIKDFATTYRDYMNYADKANTADNWWDWASNSVMAGISKTSMNWQELMVGKFDIFDTAELRGIRESIGNFGKWISDGLNGIGDAWNNFWNSLDLVGAVNTAWQGFSEWLQGIDIIGSIMSFFTGGEDSNGMMMIDTSWLTNLAMGIGNAIVTFDWSTAFSTLASTFNIGTLLNYLAPNDGGVSVLNWVNTSLIQPLTLGIQTGITSIPIIGDIASMLGLVPQQNENARQTGYNLMDKLGQGVQQKIGEIPILGDIARMLGLIPQQNGNAHDKGHGIGDNIKEGEKAGQQGTAQNVASEMSDVVTAISNSIGQAFSTAQQVGSAIWNGINSILKRQSPGFIHDQVLAEFGTDIPNAIISSGATAYSVAQQYGTQIRDGISSVNTNLSFDGMVSDYESDAQIVATTSQMMGTDTTMAFNQMNSAVNTTTSQMTGNVATAYSSMQTKQTTALNSMKQKNVTAYNDMYTKSNQSLIQMRDSTSNITHQMTNAWDHMKNQIVASANRLKHDSTVHFNTLSNTIGSFYRKIQNPSNWGAGTGSSRKPITARRPSSGRRIASALHGAGSSGGNYRGSSTMTIASLKKKICPNGDCGTIFDGYNPTDTVNVQEFLNAITGEHGFGGWSYNAQHYSHIKNKSDQWGMKSPTINLAGGIPTNSNFKVGDFENGTPKISFSEFESMARAIFTTIPYKHYYDSSWKGSWLGALQAGACNCSDGADAIIAFASACGFGGGQKVHGTWDGEGHFWAVINGKVFDTTAMQQRGSWTSSAVHGYGSPVTRTAVPSSNYGNNEKKVVNITVQFNEPVYGVDDLDSRIKNGVKEGLREEFNDPYTVLI